MDKGTFAILLVSAGMLGYVIFHATLWLQQKKEWDKTVSGQ